MYIQRVYPSRGDMKTSLFLSNRTQAVRLPKAVAFPPGVKAVEVVAVGRSRIICPVGETWDSWFDEPPLGDEFMAERDQPSEQEREPL